MNRRTDGWTQTQGRVEIKTSIQTGWFLLTQYIVCGRITNFVCVSVTINLTPTPHHWTQMQNITSIQNTNNLTHIPQTITHHKMCTNIIKYHMYEYITKHHIHTHKHHKCFTLRKEKKVRDLTQSYDKSPYTSRKVKKAKWQHKQRHTNFDYTAVADRLRTVSWNSYGFPTGVFNRFTGPTFPLPPTAV